jgi:fucose permease
MTALRGRRLLLSIALLAFVSLGLPDGVLGVSWPSIRQSFALPLSQLGSLLATAMTGYLLASFLSGTTVRRLGVGGLLLGSSLLVVISLLGYSLAPSWAFMVALGFFTGLGAGAIDAGINAWAAQNLSPAWITWLHASYGVGAALGPMAMTAAITAGAGWRGGYAVIGIALAGMSLLFLLTLPAWGRPRAHDASDPISSPWGALLQPGVGLNAMLFFLYVGIEVAAGQWAFSLLTESRGWAIQTAGFVVAGYWAGLTVGRMVFGILAQHMDIVRLLRAGMAGAIVCAAGFWLAPAGALDAIALCALAFCLAPVFPLLMADTPRRVGAAAASHAVGFQVAATYVGAAALPGLAGVLARHLGLEVIGPFLLVMTCALIPLHELAVRRAGASTVTRVAGPHPTDGKEPS